MKRIVITPFLFLAVFLFSCRADAQVFAQVANTWAKDFGYDYNMKLALGRTWASPKWEVEISANYALSPKTEVHNGYSFGGGAEILRKNEQVLFGIGIFAHKQITSDWSKSNLRAELAGGIENGSIRVLIRVISPPVKLSEDSWVYSPTISLDTRFKLSRHFWGNMNVFYDHIWHEVMQYSRDSTAASLGLRYNF